MSLPELRMCFPDATALAGELDGNLKHGRAFIPGTHAATVLADCVLLLVHPVTGGELSLPALVVLVNDSGPMCGVGLQLRPFDPSVVDRITTFVHAPPEPAPEAIAAPEPIASEAAAGEPVPSSSPDPAEAAAEAQPTDAAESEDAGDAADGPEDVQKQPALMERIRKLSQIEQQKVARNGELNDRVMLERVYGKSVWEGLLHNPKLTVPEVARIARKGTMPRPLLEVILDNGAWIQAPVVRRALLSNPRITSEAILKLLRITPKHELKSIYKTTTYSAQVREVARKVLEA